MTTRFEILIIKACVRCLITELQSLDVFLSRCCAAFAGCLNRTPFRCQRRRLVFCSHWVESSSDKSQSSAVFWIGDNFTNESKRLGLKECVLNVRMKKVVISVSSHLWHWVVICFGVSNIHHGPKPSHPSQLSSFYNDIAFHLIKIFFILFFFLSFPSCSDSVDFKTLQKFALVSFIQHCPV